MPIVFELKGHLAMFRKPYTTTSSISYPFPPPTTVAGLISAIVGIENGSENNGYSAKFWQELAGNRIAIKILSNIKWYTTTLNFWNVKEPQRNTHIQIKHQFVKDPAYRIYVDGPISDKLDKYLSSGSFVYTPYLGVTYAIAQIKYIGRFSNEEIPHENIYTQTIIPYESDEIEIDVEKSGGILREIVPFQMDEERNLTKSINVIYQAKQNDHGVFIKKGNLEMSKVGDDTVAWFPRW
ncbi:MAG: type I-B CRISPR-associated protein Cas5b [Athalassotoga sp.]